MNIAEVMKDAEEEYKARSKSIQEQIGERAHWVSRYMQTRGMNREQSLELLDSWANNICANFQVSRVQTVHIPGIVESFRFTYGIPKGGNAYDPYVVNVIMHWVHGEELNLTNEIDVAYNRAMEGL